MPGFYVTLLPFTVEIEVSCTTVSETTRRRKKMTEATTNNPRPSSTLQKNAEVLHVLYGLLDSDRDPTDADAQSLRVLYACS